MAYTRALSLQAWNVSNPSEIALATHLWQRGKFGLTGLNYAFSYVVSSLPFSLQHAIINKFVAQGCDETIMLRKLMIADQVDKAIAGGIKQIVFLGGGYDVRAFMVAMKHSDVTVYELDRGPTRESKIAGLMSIPDHLGYASRVIKKNSETGTLAVGTNLQYINCDIGVDDVASKLNAHGFNSAIPSLFIGEGLTMYLSEEDNQKLLRTLFTLMTDNSKCLLSYMAPRLKMSSIESSSLKETGELYRTPLNPEQVIPFVGPCGFDVIGRCNAANRLPLIGVVDSGLFKETYYLMNKAERVPAKSINDVPQIDFPLPIAHAPAASMCTII
jgi:methyltransferase (TIGR00027 family)